MRPARLAICGVLFAAACADEGRMPTPGGGRRDGGGGGGNRAPVVEILSPIGGSTIAPGLTVLSGRATDPEDGPLEGDALEWASNVDGNLGRGATITATLTEGRHMITLVAADREGELGSDQVMVTVGEGGNRPPDAFIDQPMNGAVFVEGAVIDLVGRAVDPEEGSLAGSSLAWTSSLQGSLGSGAQVAIAQPMLGRHTIILTAIDSQGAQGLASIELEVAPAGSNLAPAVAISQPPANATFTAGTQVDLRGTAMDPEDGRLSGASMEWRSSRSGVLGNGESVAATGLAVGVHTITLTATDSQGLAGRDTRLISINPPGNMAPSAAIARPMNGATLPSNTPVTLSGSASDPEDGMLSGARLVWTSSRDGMLGTGTMVVVAQLSAGSHLITLVATDSGGAVGTAQISLTVLAANTAPVVTIHAPATGSTFMAGDTINFMGSAQDPEDGALSGMSLVWQSNLDGRMGTGAALAFSSLTAGMHRVTLTAIDSGGLSGSAAVDLTVRPVQVNLPPVADLVGPTMGNVGQALAFDASGSRDSDGTIADYRFDWGDGSMATSGTSQMAMHTFSTAGTFTVTLTVRDDDGATAMDTLAVTTMVAVPVPGVVVDTADTYGTSCAIAVDGADHLHVVYRNNTHGQLWYASYDGSAWTTDLVEGPGFDTGGEVGAQFDVAVTSAGVPHVAYRTDSDGVVRHATRSGGRWTREQVSRTNLSSNMPVAVALDPSQGGRATVAWTNYSPAGAYRPVVAFRGGPGAWSEQVYTAGDSSAHFTGGLTFNSAGVAFLSFGRYAVNLIRWSSAMGFHGLSATGNNAADDLWAPLVLDAAGQPIIVTREATLHLVAMTWVVTPWHLGQPSQHDAATNAAGNLFIALQHGNEIEIAQNDPFWRYTYQGPMDSTRIGLAHDRTRPRACFFRSGNLMVY